MKKHKAQAPSLPAACEARAAIRAAVHCSPALLRGAARDTAMDGAGRGAGAPDIYDVYCEVPSLVVGRIIGKGGATIKEVTARSGARVSVDSGATAGMSLLHAAGRPEALESARMLINNALAPKAR